MFYEEEIAAEETKTTHEWIALYGSQMEESRDLLIQTDASMLKLGGLMKREADKTGIIDQKEYDILTGLAESKEVLVRNIKMISDKISEFKLEINALPPKEEE